VNERTSATAAVTNHQLYLAGAQSLDDRFRSTARDPAGCYFGQGLFRCYVHGVNLWLHA
jgi:hypothetical protein